MMWHATIQEDGKIALPEKLRKILKLKKGMTVFLKVEGNRVIMEIKEPELPEISVGKKITKGDIKRLLGEGIEDKFKEVLSRH